MHPVNQVQAMGGQPTARVNIFFPESQSYIMKKHACLFTLVLVFVMFLEVVCTDCMGVPCESRSHFARLAHNFMF
jgi:hypothetical protein